MNPIGNSGLNEQARNVAIGALSPAKRALLERMLGQSAAVDGRPSFRIPRRGRDQELLLSFAQQRIWLWQQLNPDAAAYHVRSFHRIVGPLKVDVLTQCLSALVRRHEILRTTYHFDGDNPVQRVEEPADLSIPLSDLSRVSEPERSAEIASCLRHEIRKPFDLERGLPFRFRLLKLADDEHIFTIMLHHIACDGWSLDVLLRELSELYELRELDHPSLLAELPLQFADFAQWQRVALSGDALSRQRDYWTKQLVNAPAVLGFPTDYPRPAMQTFNGSRGEIPLPRSLIDTLSETGRREGATLYMTTLAALLALLFRYTGRNDIVVGTPVAGRDRVETEGLIGCFINTLVLRANLNSELSFRELLQRVREVTVDAFTHQGFPFERLLEELQPQRNLSYSPLFQVLFALENVPRPCLKLPGLCTERIESESGTSQFDVAVSLRSRDDGSMRVVFEYNTDLFRPSTVSAMLENYRLLLNEVASRSDCRIAELPFSNVLAVPPL